MIDKDKINEKETPVKVGDLMSVKIESLGKLGEGVAKIGKYGFIILVNGGVLGKIHYIQITRVLSTYAFARVLSDTEYVKLVSESEVKNNEQD